MRILVILAHPDPNSFNHAIAHTTITTLRSLSHTVVLHDLYAEEFAPLLPHAEILSDVALDARIAHYCADLLSADGVVVVHPNWWGKPPAILAGYIDRVFRPGLVYAFPEQDDGSGVPIGLLKACVALIFTTSNTPAEREQAIFGDPLEPFWTRCVFGLCGVQQVFRHNFSVVVSSTLEQRQGWLNEVASTIVLHFGQ
jgi:putative NADPH-quinone reductase